MEGVGSTEDGSAGTSWVVSAGGDRTDVIIAQLSYWTAFLREFQY
jgi:hypothetical protein